VVPKRGSGRLWVQWVQLAGRLTDRPIAVDKVVPPGPGIFALSKLITAKESAP